MGVAKDKTMEKKHEPEDGLTDASINKELLQRALPATSVYNYTDQKNQAADAPLQIRDKNSGNIVVSILDKTIIADAPHFIELEEHLDQNYQKYDTKMNKKHMASHHNRNQQYQEFKVEN